MKRFLITIGIIAITGVLTSLWWTNGLSPVNKSDKTPHIFVVSKGQGIREISKNLKDQGLIKDQIVFFLLTKKLGLDKKIEAGDYRLFKSMPATEIANNLTHGTLDIWVTIPEGTRAQEIADTLKKQVPSFKESWRTELEKNEGYLFPDTYLIPRDATIDLIINTMKKNFESKYKAFGQPKNGMSKEDVVKIASLVEREAKFDRDRPLVASVIINRLSMGMKLDIDATIQYALGFQEADKRWWKKSLTLQDLQLQSPYNTYTNAGLPPTPISNPGIASLDAVINPTTSNFLYYVSDSKGNNHYSTTLEGQQQNIKKYGL